LNVSSLEEFDEKCFSSYGDLGLIFLKGS